MYDNLVQISVFLNSMGERGPEFYEALVEIEGNVSDVKDQNLDALYQSLVATPRDLESRDKVVREAEYATVIKELGRLGDAAAMQANEADIEVKRSIGLDGNMGIYGPPFWKAT